MADAKSFVFVVRDSADIDQMAPVMWQSLEMGERVTVIVASNYSPANDFRLKFLASYDGFTLKHLPSAAFTPSGLSKYGRVRWSAPRTRQLLRKLDAGLCMFEWGDGVADIAKANGMLSRVRRALFTDFVLQAQLSAKRLGIPTVALPHGHSTKLNLIRSKQVERALANNEGKLPFANRDSFDAYVFCANYHRDVIVENSTMSGNNVEVWGSARFSREWLHVLYRIAPMVQMPALNNSQQHRVLFFLPKWHNMVDRGATISLLHALGKLASIQLVISGHVRGDDTQLTATETAQLKALPSVAFAPEGANSVSLIRECNALIDVDSSIAFDAIQLGKLYIRPKYLQDAGIRTVYDEFGGALQANTQGEVVSALSAQVLPMVSAPDVFRSAVIGDEASSISQQYVLRLRQLMQQ
jgi:hypothetical protein